jgi:hypothetical protein
LKGSYPCYRQAFENAIPAVHPVEVFHNGYGMKVSDIFKAVQAKQCTKATSEDEAHPNGDLALTPDDDDEML